MLCSRLGIDDGPADDGHAVGRMLRSSITKVVKMRSVMKYVWKRRLSNNDDGRIVELKVPMYFAYVGNKERTFIGTWIHTKENSSTRENKKTVEP